MRGLNEDRVVLLDPHTGELRQMPRSQAMAELDAYERSLNWSVVGVVVIASIAVLAAVTGAWWLWGVVAGLIGVWTWRTK